VEIVMSFMFTVYNGFIFVYLFYSYVPISITREGDIFLPCFDYNDESFPSSIINISNTKVMLRHNITNELY
jgi:hypothetical protein